jgi:DNA gyrase subunit A
LKPEEKIAALIRVISRTSPTKEDVTWQQPGLLFFATRQGTVKKTALSEFANVRKGGIIAITIEPDDALIAVKLTEGQNQVVLITQGGMSIRFSEETCGRWAVQPRGARDRARVG